MNSEFDKTDIRKQRNDDNDDEQRNLISDKNKKNKKFGTYINDDDFDNHEPTDKDGNVSGFLFICN